MIGRQSRSVVGRCHRPKGGGVSSPYRSGSKVTVNLANGKVQWGVRGVSPLGIKRNARARPPRGVIAVEFSGVALEATPHGHLPGRRQGATGGVPETGSDPTSAIVVRVGFRDGRPAPRGESPRPTGGGCTCAHTGMAVYTGACQDALVDHHTPVDHQRRPAPLAGGAGLFVFLGHGGHPSGRIPCV